MMNYYVLSDIHAFCSLFRNTLRDAGYDDDPGEKKILILGDLFDRGQEALALQDCILDLMRDDRVILIKGNHEDLFQDLVTKDRGRPLRHHLQNGTYGTLEQLTGLHAGYSWHANMELARAGRETPFYTEIIPAMLEAGSALDQPHGRSTDGQGGIQDCRVRAFSLLLRTLPL